MAEAVVPAGVGVPAGAAARIAAGIGTGVGTGAALAEQPAAPERRAESAVPAMPLGRVDPVAAAGGAVVASRLGPAAAAGAGAVAVAANLRDRRAVPRIGAGVDPRVHRRGVPLVP